MNRKSGEQTVLTKATPNSDSLRTTVPMSIVKQFGLNQGDGLKWELQAKDNKLIVIVTPMVGQNA
jgi:antitoxin component of MazEF toxin-antitoxin module